MKTQQAGQETYPKPDVFTDTSTNWSIGCTRVGAPPATPHTLFLLRPRPPVRFYTVEALCRYVLFPQHTSLLFFVPHTRGALWKEHSKPGGDAKSRWTARSAPQFLLSSRISPVLPPLRSSCTEKFFSPNNFGIVPTTDSFTHPLTMLHKPACNSFSSASSPKEF